MSGRHCGERHGPRVVKSEFENLRSHSIEPAVGDSHRGEQVGRYASGNGTRLKERVIKIQNEDLRIHIRTGQPVLVAELQPDISAMRDQVAVSINGVGSSDEGCTIHTGVLFRRQGNTVNVHHFVAADQAPVVAQRKL